MPLGEVLDLSIDAVPVDPATLYPVAGVYSFGRGLFAREPIGGSETTYKVFHRLHANDFVLSKLKGWEGALAKIPTSFDGWFLSPQFPTFRAKPDRLDISFLAWYCKQSVVWEQLRNKSRGMGARRDSVSPTTFLALDIPLPSLPEQRRIVARIEELAARIEEARGLRRQAVEEAEALRRALIFGPSQAEAKPVKMSELVRLKQSDVSVLPHESYHFAGVYSFGRGVFRGDVKTGAEFSYLRLTRLSEGNFVYPKLMA